MREARELRAIVVVRVEPWYGRGDAETFELGDEVGVEVGVSSMRDSTALRQSDVCPYLIISSAVDSRSIAMCDVFSYWDLVCNTVQSTREKYRAVSLRYRDSMARTVARPWTLR